MKNKYYQIEQMGDTGAQLEHNYPAASRAYIGLSAEDVADFLENDLTEEDRLSYYMYAEDENM